MNPETLFEPNIGQTASKFIRVTSDWIAIDEEDYDFVRLLGLTIVRRAHLSHVYINTQPYYKQPLHRVLLQVTDPAIIIDHRNRNGLDNRRMNLRKTDKIGNALNMRVNATKKSGLPKGVYKKGTKYKAVITVKQLEFYLGSFSTSEEAESVYKKANENYWNGRPVREGIL